MIKDFFISVAGISLRVRQIEVAPSAALPSLVFLHEALGSIPQWRDFPERLCQAVQRSGFIIERQGHGASAPLTKQRDIHYLQEEATAVLPQVLEQLGLEKPILIGHSDGGSIALLYAAYFPTTAIVTMAAHTFVENITLQGVRRALTLKDFLISRLEKYHGDKARALFHAWNDTWLSAAFRHWDIREELSQITCPVLAIQSKDDEYGTMKQVEYIVAGVKHPVMTLVLEKGSHHPHLRAAEMLIEKIPFFIQQVTQ